MKPYYEHGGITIYHGDCREVLPGLEPVDLVLTDPPYPNRAGHFDDGIGVARGVIAGLAGHALPDSQKQQELIDLLTGKRSGPGEGE